MISGLAIFITFSLLLLSLKRAGFVPFPTGLIFILCLSQICFMLASNGEIYYNMLAIFNYGGLQQNYEMTEWIYTLTALFSFASVSGKFSLLNPRDLKSNKDLEEQKNITRKRMRKFLPIILLLLGIHIVLFFAVVDWNKLWLHHTYLESLVSSGAADMLGTALPATMLRIFPLTAIIASFCTCFAADSKIRLPQIIAFVFCVFYYLVLLGVHSRTASFVPAMGLIYMVTFKMRNRMFWVPALGILTVLSVFSALIGRASSEHGLSTVFSSLTIAFTDNKMDLFQVLLDFCQGIFVMAESLQINSPFNTTYKILSFSPLPSLLDGFGSIRSVAEHRLHRYVPMGGMGEAINFGLPYIILLAGILLWAIRTHLKLALKNRGVFLLCNFLIMFSMYLIFSYPLRTALRFAWLALYVSLIALFFKRKERTNKA